MVDFCMDPLRPSEWKWKNLDPVARVAAPPPPRQPMVYNISTKNEESYMIADDVDEKFIWEDIMFTVLVK